MSFRLHAVVSADVYETPAADDEQERRHRGSSLLLSARARELIVAAQADPGLSTELDEAFPDKTDQL